MGYWRAVELFSPQKVPGLSVRERVYAAEADRPMPWEAGHALRSVPVEPGYGWQHVVYGGTYPLSAVRDTLLDVFGESDEDHDGRMDGESALFALTVTDEGRLLLDSPSSPLVPGPPAAPSPPGRAGPAGSTGSPRRPKRGPHGRVHSARRTPRPTLMRAMARTTTAPASPPRS